MPKTDPSHLLVHLFKDAPDSKAVHEVDASNEGPERLLAIGRCVFVTYPSGIGTSKLSRNRQWGKIAALGTARNWNTVLKLETMAKGISSEIGGS